MKNIFVDFIRDYYQHIMKVNGLLKRSWMKVEGRRGQNWTVSRVDIDGIFN